MEVERVNVAHAVARGDELGLIGLRTAEPPVMIAAALSQELAQHFEGPQQREGERLTAAALGG